MFELRHLQAELSALAAAMLAAPFGRLLCEDTFEDPEAGGVPVVFVHGLFGNRAHFGPLRMALRAHGIGRFATFCYRPRIDHQALSEELGRFIDVLCERTGEGAVDVVGHSLGGLVSRYFVENGGSRRVRRLVTLGSPYYGCRFPRCELTIFAASDLLVSPPVTKAARRWVVIPNCGHLGLLRRPTVHRRVAAFLQGPRASAAERPPGKSAARADSPGLRRMPTYARPAGMVGTGEQAARKME